MSKIQPYYTVFVSGRDAKKANQIFRDMFSKNPRLSFLCEKTSSKTRTSCFFGLRSRSNVKSLVSALEKKGPEGGWSYTVVSAFHNAKGRPWTSSEMKKLRAFERFKYTEFIEVFGSAADVFKWSENFKRQTEKSEGKPAEFVMTLEYDGSPETMKKIRKAVGRRKFRSAITNKYGEVYLDFSNMRSVIRVVEALYRHQVKCKLWLDRHLYDCRGGYAEYRGLFISKTPPGALLKLS